MPFARNQSATKLVVSAVTVVLLSIAPYAVSLAGATSQAHQVATDLSTDPIAALDESAAGNILGVGGFKATLWFENTGNDMHVDR